MKIKKCRLDEDKTHRIQVCEHIAIGGTVEDDDEEEGEYTKRLNIYCSICKKTYSYDELIN